MENNNKEIKYIHRKLCAKEILSIISHEKGLLIQFLIYSLAIIIASHINIFIGLLVGVISLSLLSNYVSEVFIKENKLKTGYLKNKEEVKENGRRL